jgi:hypothetical protein
MVLKYKPALDIQNSEGNAVQRNLYVPLRLHVEPKNYERRPGGVDNMVL